MKTVLLNDWKDNKIEKFVREELGEVDWLFGSYSYKDYSGDVFVLFKKEGKIFEVSGGHCSCYGIEGQWKPEETSIDAIKLRLDNNFGKCESDYGDGNEFHNELKEFIAQVSAR